MKSQILRIAGVKSEKEFYRKFPTEESFMMKHGGELMVYQDGGGVNPMEGFIDYNDYMSSRGQEEYYAPQQGPIVEQQYIQTYPQAATEVPKKYNGPSVVDYLNSEGTASDYSYRKALAESLGIKNYTGSSKQNLELVRRISENPEVLKKNPPKKRTSSTKKVSTATAKEIVKQQAQAPVVDDENPWVDNPAQLPTAEEAAAYLDAANKKYGKTKGSMVTQPTKNQNSYSSRAGANPYANTVLDPWDDSRMLRRIDNDPKSQKNLNSKHRKEFARDLAIGTLAPWLAEGALMAATMKMYPYGAAALKGLPEVTATARHASRALPYATRALPNSTSGINNGARALSEFVRPHTGFTIPNMGIKSFYAQGGPVEGQEMEVSPEELEMLRAQGYQIEIL